MRERTAEVLKTLERWPLSYDDLPEKLRLASRLNALSHLQQFAKMLRRQGDDFEGELKSELTKMASGDGSVLQFSRFVAGDYTGNLSDTGLKELLSSLQVSDCWATFRTFSASVGIGVPSVQELVRSVVRKRHRSAHSSSYSPTATEITGLPIDILCIAMCFDVAVTASMERSLVEASEWAAGDTAWNDKVNLYLFSPHSRGFRLVKAGSSRALRIMPDAAAVRGQVPRAATGFISVLVEQNAAGRPLAWEIL